MVGSSQATDDAAWQADSGLKRSLGLPSVLAQSIASIGLSATAVINVPDIFVDAGGATWVTFVLATILILFVALSINVFAGRFSGPASLAAFASEGLGEKAGLVTAWALVLTYVGNVGCCLGGFVDTAAGFLSQFGLSVPHAAIYVAGGVFCCAFAMRAVKTSTYVMLITEIVSIAIVLVLCAFIVSHHSVQFDTSEWSVSPSQFSGIQAGLLLAVLSFVGFESAASLGHESRNPQRIIPLTIILAPLLAGGFFILCAYALGLGFQSAPREILLQDSPLGALSIHLGLPGLGHAVSLGGAICFLGASMAALTAAGRILMALAQRGIMPAFLGRVDAAHHTPSAALLFTTAIAVVVGALLERLNPLPALTFNLLGTFAVVGFLIVYLITVTAGTFYLKRIGQLTALHITIAVITSICLLGVGLASTLPPPAGIVGWAPLFFVVMWIVGGIAVLRRSRPDEAG